MLHLITYDVETDRPRTKLAKVLENAGLSRIQYSVFVGLLSETEKQKLLEQVQVLLKNEANFHLLCVPLHSDMLTGLFEMSDKPLDWEYLGGTKACIVF
ncbi:MAG: CRISPR-associated endonuclease Cas2 [Bacteroidetes bacterium]|nr:CRISPR-associated endonuclease Cas2 [Bacteroidota bacterium]